MKESRVEWNGDSGYFHIGKAVLEDRPSQPLRDRRSGPGRKQGQLPSPPDVQ